MERYTEWRDGHGCGLPGKDCFSRLAAYEDAMSLKRAQELALAELDGRLLVLPANVTVAQLAVELHRLDQAKRGDEEDIYTAEYRHGHKDGEMALLRRILKAQTAERGRKHEIH